ncbi:hypothetical protein C0J52_12317 [Blattella germanica]|nr:hypothetical protein C0J52_12317 [Blattella germanica]
MTMYQVTKFYALAFLKAANMRTAINGFKNTAIFPLNPDVFPDWMHAPSETTERRGPVNEEQPTENQTTQQHSEVDSAGVISSLNLKHQTVVLALPASTSHTIRVKRKNWAHEECCGEEDNLGNFFCDYS